MPVQATNRQLSLILRDFEHLHESVVKSFIVQLKDALKQNTRKLRLEVLGRMLRAKALI